MIFAENIKTAFEKSRNYLRQTPLEYSHYLSQQINGHVYLKLDNLQITGSFKLRGALNKYMSLSSKNQRKGIVTASTGNHGAAVAYLLQKFDTKGIIFLPENAVESKIKFLEQFEPELRFYGTDCIQTELYAKNFARKNAMTYIPPYNDPYIIAGQGTIAVEIIQQMKRQYKLDQIDHVLVPVGGGGLIAGVGVYLKKIVSNIKITGCQPENSAVMNESIKAGKIVEMESKPTLSDATAGGIEQDSITFDICRKYVDRFILVNEEEIKSAIRLILEKHFLLIEGAAALTVASLIKKKKEFEGKYVVLIFSGSKIDLKKLKDVLT